MTRADDTSDDCSDDDDDGGWNAIFYPRADRLFGSSVHGVDVVGLHDYFPGRIRPTK